MIELFLYSSQKWKKVKMPSDALHLDNVLEILSDLLNFWTPKRCLWQDNVGQALNLLETILGQCILSFTRQEGSTGHLFLDSTLGNLHVVSHYEPYPGILFENPVYSFNIPILHTGSHFQALISPKQHDFSHIRSLFVPYYRLPTRLIHLQIEILSCSISHCITKWRTIYSLTSKWFWKQLHFVSLLHFLKT